MEAMASKNHWSLRNQRNHSIVLLMLEGWEGALMGLCVVGDVDFVGESVFFRSSAISLKFISTFPIASVIVSSGSK